MGKRAKGSTNQYDYVLNRSRHTLPPRVMVGDYNSSLMQMPKYYPQEFTESNWDRPESGSATTQTLLLVGGLVAVVSDCGVCNGTTDTSCSNQHLMRFSHDEQFEKYLKTVQRHQIYRMLPEEPEARLGHIITNQHVVPHHIMRRVREPILSW